MRFWAVVVLAAGCASSAQSVRVAMTLQGNALGPAEQQRCLAAAQQAGAIVDANAPVQALVTVDKDATRLQVVTMRRGLVRDERRTPASIEAVCKDAVAAAAAAHEPAGVDAPATAATQSTAPPPWSSTSGGVYRGPISDQ